MSLTHRRAGRFALSLVAATAVLAGTGLAGTQDTVSKTFAVSPGGRLTLNTDIGSIRVQGSTEPSVKVDVIRTINTSSERRAKEILEDFDLAFDQKGDDVFVTGDYRREPLGRFFRDLFRRLKVEFVVSVPRPYNVELRTSGGGISVTDVEGETRARTSGGALRFDGLKGPVYGRTSGGSIEAGSVAGEADLDTSGGGIRVRDVSGRLLARTSGGSIRVTRAGADVDVHTSGGGITLEEVAGAVKADTSGGSITAAIVAQPQAECRLSTSGGGISLSLAEGLALTLDARSSGGRVTADVPVTVQGEIGRGSLRGAINGGGPLLHLRTSGGGIRISRR